MIRELWSCFWAYVSISYPRLIWVLLFASVFWLIFWGVQRKVPAGQQESKGRAILYRGLLSFSCSFIYVMTLFGRCRDTGEFRLTPFVSYRMAFQDKNIELLLQILVNVAMYIPVGMLLPCCFRVFQKARYTLLAVFFCSLCIELSQGLFQMGIFETDDIMDNLLGATIGFLLYKIIRFLRERVKRFNCL